MNYVLLEYKKLPDIVKNNLHYILSYNACYKRDNNISDNMVNFITSLSQECWLDDIYSRASIDYYTDYLLDAIYDYGATKEDLEDLDVSDIIESFNNNKSAEEILKFKKDDYIYCFTTNENLKYYSQPGNDNGFYIVNENDRCIRKPHPMDNAYDDVFDLLKQNKITNISMDMHYNIRCMIKNDIFNDKELLNEYKLGIENYKKYCLDRYITSEDILKITGLDTDISLTEIDGSFTKLNKMNRLANYYHNIDKKGNSYDYVGSLNNGTDYYYKNGKYLALDKNNIVKEFDDKKNFMLKELQEKYKFAFLSDSELSKIACDIENDYLGLRVEIKDNILEEKSLYAVSEFMRYENSKEHNTFKNPNLSTYINGHIRFKEEIEKELKKEESQRIIRKQKNNEKEIEI